MRRSSVERGQTQVRFLFANATTIYSVRATGDEREFCYSSSLFCFVTQVDLRVFSLLLYKGR